MENEFSDRDIEEIKNSILNADENKLRHFVQMIKAYVTWPLSEDEVITFFKNEPDIAANQITDAPKTEILKIFNHLGISSKLA